jgi:hypothetical protein
VLPWSRSLTRSTARPHPVLPLPHLCRTRARVCRPTGRSNNALCSDFRVGR